MKEKKMKEKPWRTKKITIGKAPSWAGGYQAQQGGKFIMAHESTKKAVQKKVKLLRKCYKEFPPLKSKII